MRSGSLVIMAVLASLGMGGMAQAQDSTPTLQRAPGQSNESRLLRMAELLGNLHYVRVLCDPAEGEFWRDRMMELIRLEKPSIGQRNRMIEQFNAGYEDAASRYGQCTREARTYASTVAREGEAISDELASAIKTDTSG